jgi:hypothetical protein
MKEPKMGAGTLELASDMEEEAMEVTFLLRILPYVGPRMEAAERIGVPPPRLELDRELEGSLWPLVPGGAGSCFDSMDENDPAKRKRCIIKSMF